MFVTAIGVLAFQAQAENVGFMATPEKNSPYLWSSTDEANKPWVNGALPTENDVALFYGYNNATTTGYLKVDGQYTIRQFMISGSGGNGSSLNLIFDDTQTSSLTIKNQSLISLNNNHHVYVSFTGKGTITLKNSDAYINSTSTSTGTSSFTFGEDVTVNAATSLNFAGQADKSALNTLNIHGNISGSTTTGSFKANNENSKVINVSGTKAQLNFSQYDIDNAVLNITDGGRVVSTKNTYLTSTNTTVGANSSLIVGATLSVDGTEGLSTTSIAGTLSARTLSISNNSELVIESTGKLEVSSGGISFHTNRTSSQNKPSLIVKSSGNSVTGDIFLPEFGGLSVSGDNDWASTIMVRGGRTLLYVDGGATFEIDGIAWVNRTESTVYNKEFRLSVDADSLLILASMNAERTSGSTIFKGLGQVDSGKLNLEQFNENTILFRELGTEAEQTTFLDRVFLNGQAIENLHFSAYDAKAGGYWLTAAIPEPAEWAAILGTFAFAITIYRRRK